MTWWSRRSLRGRLALLSALAVTLAVAAASVLAYVTTARTMLRQVDDALTSLDAIAAAGEQVRDDVPGGGLVDLALPELLCARAEEPMAGVESFLGRTQLVRADGSVCVADESRLIEPTAEDVAVAAGRAQTRPRDAVAADGTHLRVQTTRVGEGYALMVARDLTETDTTLARLRLLLTLLTCGGAIVAGGAGLLVARTGLRPVEGLTRAAERVATTQDLDVPIPVRGNDEVARLARTFNTMIAALAGARERQQQLIADASHELRTPLASLRTNVELLLRVQRSDRVLPADEHEALLESVAAQLAELGDLISELTLLARADAPREPVPVRLDDVVRRAAGRASRRGDHDVRLDLAPWLVDGDPADLERAVLNVLDNAVKFAPGRSVIEVRLSEGALTVADEGPGIPPAERELALERFWRSPTARSTPGSGLGLAVVADVIRRHGGTVELGAADGGGALVRLSVPGRAPGGPTTDG